LNRERAFILLVATALKVLVNDSADVPVQTAPKKNRKRRVRQTHPEPLRDFPDLGLDLGDNPEAQFDFLKTGHVRTPPPPREDNTMPTADQRGYAPSRENDTLGTADSLPWLGNAN
jgi:hypothetical protein